MKEAIEICQQFWQENYTDVHMVDGKPVDNELNQAIQTLISHCQKDKFEGRVIGSKECDEILRKHGYVYQPAPGQPLNEGKLEDLIDSWHEDYTNKERVSLAKAICQAFAAPKGYITEGKYTPPPVKYKANFNEPGGIVQSATKVTVEQIETILSENGFLMDERDWNDLTKCAKAIHALIDKSAPGGKK